ncbi:MAG: hypothetical protein QMD12_01620 [Candidatus Aenigmarchaeota archaeon]|nr:hypothetical protein [Candidatus Aenigmarchaeota archaeon]
MRGQIFSIDLFIAIAVFIVVFWFYILTWERLTLSLKEVQAMKGFEALALSISDSLVRFPGAPERWEENVSNVSAIGLAYAHVFDKNKIRNFTSLDYNRTKKLIGLDGYEFYFKVYYLNRSVFAYHGNAPVNFKQAVSTKRFGLLEGEAVVMELTIWD